MFTGIVAELGTVVAIEETDEGRTVEVAAIDTLKDLAIGDSVAVNGVCLTVVRLDDRAFRVDAIGETLARSTAGNLRVGDRANLERPLAAGGRFDGHVVQGHVDGVGQIAARTREGDAERIRIRMPAELDRYLVEKGSITVDGVSLTVTAVSARGEADPWFEVALIPHTMDVTVLGVDRPVGSAVNLEVDVLAKYVERMMETQP